MAETGDGDVTASAPIGPRMSPSLSRTLGSRLHQAGERLITGHRHVPVWAAFVAPALERMVDRQEFDHGRFHRVELEPASRPPEAPTVFRSGVAMRRTDPAEEQGRPVPADVSAWLRIVSGPGAERVLVRTDGSADALARSHDADAVTVSETVHLRGGRFSISDPEGLALLAHESRHVADAAESSIAPGPATPVPSSSTHRPTTTESVREAAALAVEQAVLLPGVAAGGPPDLGRRGPARDTVASGAASRSELPGAGPTLLFGSDERLPSAPDRQAPAPVATSRSAPAGQVPVSRAAVDRPLVRPQSASATLADMAALRSDLLSEIVRQLHTEFERGG